MKKTILVSVVAVILFSYLWTGARDWVEKRPLVLQESWNGPLEAMVSNQSGGTYAMTEIRAINDKGCANDLGTTGSNYDDPSDRSLSRNRAFLVSESTCDGMQIKANRGDIEFITWLPPRPCVSQTDNCTFRKSTPVHHKTSRQREQCCVWQEGGAVWITSRRGSRQLIP